MNPRLRRAAGPAPGTPASPSGFGDAMDQDGIDLWITPAATGPAPMQPEHLAASSEPPLELRGPRSAALQGPGAKPNSAHRWAYGAWPRQERDGSSSSGMSPWKY